MVDNNFNGALRMAEFKTNDTGADFSAEDINRIFVRTAIPLSVAFGILCVIGTFGNSLIVYVYVTKYPPCNFRYFVVILGTVDLIRCLFTIPGEIYTQYTWFLGPITEICKTKFFLNAASITCSTVIFLLIAVDRYRKVCHPFGWQIKHAVAFRLSIVLGIVCVVWSTPTLIFCGPQTFMMKYARTNVSVTICLKDNSYKDTMWPFLILKAVYAGPTSVIMFTTLILYIFVANYVFKKTKRRAYMKPNSAASRSGNELSMDLSVAGISDTAHERSEDITEDFGELHRARTEKTSIKANVSSLVDSAILAPISNIRSEKMEELSPKTEHNGAFYVKVGTASSTFLFDFPMINIKASQERSSASTYSTFQKPLNNLYSKASKRRNRSRMRRNTLIMFILTLCFTITIIIYFVLSIQIADTKRFFNKLTLWQAILAMFFLRLYYFNSLINAIVYGLLDPRFRRALRRASRRISRSVASMASIKRHNRR